MHKILPQHAIYIRPDSRVGNRIIQIGQSKWGGRLNNFSSYNSATRLSQAFLCFVQCLFLHAALQYITDLHLLQLFVTSLPSLPQLAHALDEQLVTLLMRLVGSRNSDVLLMIWIDTPLTFSTSTRDNEMLLLLIPLLIRLISTGY